ncbi:MAG: PSD1 domain-containing protein [Planctomycetes bacterium]|nr:PSD1 domain-containing protein [Planctomycetota bacterium]
MAARAGSQQRFGRIALGVGLALVGILAQGSVLRAAEGPVLFETHVLPILETRCLKCHGEGKTKGGLDLRRKFTILKGGDSGPAIVPGKPKESLLVERLEKGEMPPAKDEALSARQREVIRLWVSAGAPLAKAKEPPLQETEVTTRLSDEDRRFWAFQPPKRPPLPRVSASHRVRNPIDAFLLARLEAKGLSFNPDASQEVLLRRLCFDLLGLPPTPQQREEFLADPHPDAYERLVDRLLASPAYGERWGRHWLDLAGYADSDGYLAADHPRPEAWRYRDYVIQALNDDLPYDRFVTEQLAGDELSDWRRAKELTPQMVRQLTATGFLRTALDPTYPGYTEPNEIYQVLSDTMQIVSSSVLGLTIQCARCHEHKFDPISQRDYYALRTIFLAALDPDRWQPSGARGIPMATEAQQAALQERNRKAAEKAAQQVKTLSLKLGELMTKNPNKLKPEQLKVETDRLKAAIVKAAQAQQKKEAPVLIRGLTDLDGKPPEGHILRRGDYHSPGAVVASGVPEVLAPPGYRLPIRAGFKTTGRRLALAHWLTDPAHPLTARVQVNRMWAHHFGRGIVPTVANFGRSGAKPTHPELLDWLATEFIHGASGAGGTRASGSAPGRNGAASARRWSLKAIHRLMVTSTAYRQTSAVDAAKSAADPNNVLLGSWRPHRHEGEVLRDSILAVSGKLSGQRFGPPAPVVAHADGAVADRILTANPKEAERVAFAYQLLFARQPRPSETEKVRKFLAAVVEEHLGGKPVANGTQHSAERAAWTQAALVLLNSNEFLYVH